MWFNRRECVYLCVCMYKVTAHAAYDKCKPHQICCENEITEALKAKKENKERNPVKNETHDKMHEIYMPLTRALVKHVLQLKFLAFKKIFYNFD